MEADDQSRLQEILQMGRRFIGRATLILSMAAGPAVALEAESTIVPQAAYASTTFTNDYPDMDAVDCHTIYGQYSWCKGSPSTPTSPRLYDYRNCTDGAAYWVNKYTGANVSGWGNAKDWDNNAPASEVYAGSTNNIEPGDIAQSDDGTYGHVGFVTSVTKNSDGTVASFTTAELNQAGNGEYNGSTSGDKTVYNTRDAAGNFIRYGSYDWDHFIDVNGLGKGLNNESLSGGGTPANPVTAVSSQQINGTEHVYWATADGIVRESWFDPQQGAFTNTAWRIGHKVTALSSQYTSSDMAQHIYVGTDNGQVDEIWWSPSSGGYHEWTAAQTDGQIDSLDSRIDSGGTTHLYWGSDNGHVDETWFNPTQGANTWEISHSNSPVYGMTNQYTSDGTEHVYWGNNEGRLHESYFKPGWGPFTNVMAQFPQPISGLSSQTESDGSQHIVSSDNDGIVRETWFSSTSNGYNTWQAAVLGSAPHAISSQLTPDGNMHAYTGDNNEVDETWYHPGTVNTWAAASNTPPVTSISSQIDSGGTTHLFWGGNDGLVRETWFRPGTVNSWTLPTSS